MPRKANKYIKAWQKALKASGVSGIPKRGTSDYMKVRALYLKMFK